MVPLSHLRQLLVAVFLLFSTFGFYADIMAGGRLSYPVLFANGVISGAISMIWIFALARLPLIGLAIPIAISALNPLLTMGTDRLLERAFHLAPVDPVAGIRVAASATMIALAISYVFFVSFIRRQGRESFKLRNELELAHGIQKTLVPPVSLHTARFEVYGISCPSEKVGGDLVDALCLSNGDAVAYLADIAGHGLQAGILMGMLKTAVRTALLDAGERDASQTLPVLLERINDVLPVVKEAHMYATFTGLRLGVDGGVYYALAASPPLLHWHTKESTLSHLEEEQFPLGLLPVSGFAGQKLETAPGDLLVVATDGILEVCDKSEQEFGLERLKAIIEADAKAPLAELAKKILTAANGFGKQADDQTILLVRCL
ncbi:serine phosphatase RsbU (regulator of sigma subunit) [Silvibacterium bohemicum]|uniref:Serine phosphatase RsbU (Regulator of sigma subunit) n=1 Tax=Silvibacterium bohemicum TaxID=1577686 RepID=A0A841JWC2_9BACT|nr:PP2C family protein-serine/threonine phosphatase [Silvibacterium bohemicum]MBB6144029.1 serine phosphatase RsbU (regulator of sigma subunit) [Silvibacterium bohemicum]